MKIPENISKENVFQTIETIINRIAPKYTFHGYEIDDIKQEAFLICVDALDRYDPTRPLENFLSVNLSNRLKNFVRDNHYTKSGDQKKKALLPIQLLNEESLEDNRINSLFSSKEIFDIIDKYINIEYRADYLKLLNNIHINKKRKLEVIQHIRKILEDHDYA